MYPVDSPFRLRSRENKLSLKHRDFLGHVVVYLWLFIYTPVGQLGCNNMITSLLSITKFAHAQNIDLCVRKAS